MMEICGDNRFEIIAKAKEHLLDATNIDTSEDEMKVLDSFLFRCWQMGWLDRYDRKTKSNSEKTNNCEVKNYCDDCLYTDTCDSKEFFYACTSKPTISKMEQVDEPQTEDGIMPEVKAGVRFDENNKTLWIKTDTVENYDRVIIEDGSNWCRIFYEECGECAHNKPRSNDEPQTDCPWR